MTKLERIAELLKHIKPHQEKDENWMVYDGCGGNIDDAYYMGLEDGESCLADSIREILKDG